MPTEPGSMPARALALALAAVAFAALPAHADDVPEVVCTGPNPVTPNDCVYVPVDPDPGQVCVNDDPDSYPFGKPATTCVVTYTSEEVCVHVLAQPRCLPP